MWTGSSPAHRFASSSAAVTPAKPPPSTTMRGASDVEGRASTRPPARTAASGPVVSRDATAVDTGAPQARGARRHQARSVSATLQACAMQPPGANGGSASKTSAMDPIP